MVTMQGGVFGAVAHSSALLAALGARRPLTSDAAADPLDGGIAGSGGLRRGLDPVAVVDEVLARIDGCDDPAIWIDVEPADALRAAAKALARRARRRPPAVGRAVRGQGQHRRRRRADHRRPARRGPHRGTASATVVAPARRPPARLYVGKTNLDQFATGLVGTRSPYGTPREPVRRRR